MKLKWFCLICYAGLNISLLQQQAYAESDFAYGVKFKTSVIETRGYLNNEKINFGISFLTDKITSSFPCSIKTGNLSTGGILSKMNSPLLSGAGTPFSSVSSNVNGISAELPGISGYSKPVSSFFQLGYKNNKSVFKKSTLNCWYSPLEDILVISGYSDVVFNKKIKMKNSLGAGCFPYEEKSSSSWTLKTPYYPAGNHFVSAYSGSIEFWKILFCLSSTLSESPFGNLDSTIKTEIRYSGNHFIFSLSGAYNPNEYILTASDKTVKESLQLRTSLQYKDKLIFLNKPVFYKAGTFAYLDRKILEETQTIKTGAGVQFNSGISALSLYSTVTFSLDTNEQSSSVILLENTYFNFHNSWYFKNLTPSFSLGTTLQPSEDNSSIDYKIIPKIQFAFPKNPKINTATSYTLSVKNTEIKSQKLQGSFSTDFTFYSFTASIKIAVDVDF